MLLDSRLLLNSWLLRQNSRLTVCPKKRLMKKATTTASMKLGLVVEGRGELLRKEGSRSREGSSQSWLGLKGKGARLLYRGKGGRDQGRSRGPWVLLGRVGGQSWNLLEQVTQNFLCVRTNLRVLPQIRDCRPSVSSNAVGHTWRGSIYLREGLSSSCQVTRGRCRNKATKTRFNSRR